MRKVKEILIENSFRFNKNLGQNFITDQNLLEKIAVEAGVTADDTVIEIGTGAGTLTRVLASAAKQVFSFEVDKNLQPVLAETLSGIENVEVIFSDVLKMSDKELCAKTGIFDSGFKVVANIPYYITTPLIMRFLEGGVHPQSITVMVQKEVAERLTATAGTPEYGAITAIVGLYGSAHVVGQVGKELFFPVPKVDSAIVRIDIEDNFKPADRARIARLIKCAFAMRRKTLANNLVAAFGFTKSEAEMLLCSQGFDSQIRGERLTLDDFVRLSENPVFLNK